MVQCQSATDASVSGAGQMTSRRSLFRALGLGSASLMTAGCSQEPLKRIESPRPLIRSGPPTGNARHRSSREEWVHLGDSFINLSKMVPACAELTGYEHMDASMIGDTSLIAAIRTGCEPLRARVDGGRIPAKGSVELLDFDPPAYRMHEGVEHLVEICGIRGEMIRPRGSKRTWFRRPWSGEGLDVAETVDITVDPRHEQSIGTKGFHRNYSVVFALGRNDMDIGGSVDELVKNIRTMIEKHPAKQPRYVVTEIPAWQDEEIGAPKRQELDAWNERLKQEFGDAFIEPFRWLIEHREKSFAVADRRMTGKDRTAEDNGVIPASLTLDVRGHLSIPGGKAYAAGVFEEFKRLHLV
ncbi:SGNH/GDSL hydrolase family protein [Rothia uropygialis]|uniref:SGNH/GDSL hydrolase family protein n=1 Tax=Kocuria sp. 36 TaxID=1415402 RepID=UPI00101BD5B8|nr:SGNH/GDSL hydrolase family protein [Kocuria sp. 36]